MNTMFLFLRISRTCASLMEPAASAETIIETAPVSTIIVSGFPFTLTVTNSSPSTLLNGSVYVLAAFCVVAGSETKASTSAYKILCWNFILFSPLIQRIFQLHKLLLLPKTLLCKEPQQQRLFLVQYLVSICKYLLGLIFGLGDPRGRRHTRLPLLRLPFAILKNTAQIP